MPDTLLLPDTPAALFEASPSLKAYRATGALAAYLEWTKGSELDDMIDDCTFIVLHHPSNVTQSARALVGSPNAGGTGATLQYVRQQSAAYRFQVAYSTTAGQYNSQNCIIASEWNWLAVVHRWTSGGAGTRVLGWHAVGRSGNWRPLTFSAPTEPVGTPTSDAGRPLRILANVTPSSNSYEGDLALVAAFRRRLRLEDIEDFRQDPLAWASEAAFFVRPGHHGLSVLDEGRNRKGKASVVGTLVGPAPTGLDTFWWPSGGAFDGAALFVNTLAGGITPAGARTRQVGASRSGGATPAGTITRDARRAQAGGVTPAGDLSGMKVALQSIVGSITPAGTLARQVRPTRSGVVTPVGGLRRTVSRVLSGTVAPSGSRRAVILKAFVGAIASAGSLIADVLSGGATYVYRFFATQSSAALRFRAGSGPASRFLARVGALLRFRPRP